MSGVSGSNILEILDEDFQLFKLLTARDTFIEFYNQRLLRRLINRT